LEAPARLRPGLAGVRLRPGRPPRRRPRHRLEALALFREADDATGAALTLLDLAFLLNWEGRHADAVRLAAASQSHRDRASAGPTPGFGGMLEGDPAAESGAHLTQAEARRAWEEA
jgi:hypothetical protein